MVGSRGCACWNRLPGAPVLLLLAACTTDPADPAGPAASRVQQVLVSRDSLVVEVGDSVLIRGEARDLTGQPVPEASLSWSVEQPALARTTVAGRTTWVVGLGRGITRVTAQVDGRSGAATVIVPDPITSTTLDRHRDTLIALAQLDTVGISSAGALGPRAGVYEAVSRDPGTVEAYVTVLEGYVPGTDVVMQARGNGETWVVVTERFGTRDSMLVVVRQQDRSINIVDDTIVGYPQWTRQLEAHMRDSLDQPIGNLPVEWTTGDPDVVTVSNTGLLTFTAAGRAVVRAESPGGHYDTVTVTVLPSPQVVLGSSDEDLPAGAWTAPGLYSEPVFVGGKHDGDPPWVQLELDDPTIAEVPDSVLLGTSFRARGLQAGTTKLIATAPRLRPDTLTVTSSTPQVLLRSYEDENARVVLLSEGTAGRLMLYMLDSLGKRRQGAAPVPVTIEPRDPTVVTLPQNQEPVSQTPSQGEGITLFPVHPLTVGETWVVGSAPGYRADSLLYRVHQLPKLVFRNTGDSTTLGANLRPGSNAPTIGTSLGWDRAGSLTVSFARTRPQVAGFPSAAVIAENASWAGLNLFGIEPGIDTIIASAPGYEPDTLILTVTRAHFIVPDTVRVSARLAEIYLEVGDSTGRLGARNGTIRPQATPDNPDVAGPSSSVVPLEYFAAHLPFDVRDTGWTDVTLTDADGIFAPRTFVLRVDPDTTLRFETQAGNYAVAPRQRFPGSWFLVRTPRDREGVYFESTDPSVIRVADSIPPGSGDVGIWTVPVAGGDEEGSAYIIARSLGFRPDTVGPVWVAAGRLRLTAPTQVVLGIDESITVGIQSRTGGDMPLDTTATFILIALDEGLHVPSTVTVHAGSNLSDPIPLSFSGPGRFRVAVHDQRPVPVQFAGDTVTIDVAQPWLNLNAPGVGRGQRAEATFQRQVSTDPVVVSITNRTGRVVGPTSISLSAGEHLAAYAVDGLLLGTDTLIVSADGYASDTVVVQVTEPTVLVSGLPDQLKLNQQVQVRLVVADSLLRLGTLLQPVQFEITGQGLSVTDGSAPIQVITVPAGSSLSAPFYITPTAVPASLSAWNLLYREYRRSLNVVP